MFCQIHTQNLGQIIPQICAPACEGMSFVLIVGVSHSQNETKVSRKSSNMRLWQTFFSGQ